MMYRKYRYNACIFFENLITKTGRKRELYEAHTIPSELFLLHLEK